MKGGTLDDAEKTILAAFSPDRSPEPMECPTCNGEGCITAEDGHTCYVCHGHGWLDFLASPPPPEPPDSRTLPCIDPTVDKRQPASPPDQTPERPMMRACPYTHCDCNSLKDCRASAERPMRQFIEELIGDLEGSAISENNACPECSHPSCERRRNSLPAARSALLAAYKELERANAILVKFRDDHRRDLEAHRNKVAALEIRIASLEAEREEHMRYCARPR